MIVKIIAVSSLVCAVALYIFGLLRPNDPYFFFISSSSPVALSRVLIAALATHIAFQKEFYHKFADKACAATAAALLIFGIVGFFYLPVDFTLGDSIKPLDYAFVLQPGFALAVAAATYRRGTHRLPRVARPRRTQLELFIARHA